ncbi:MAG: hypothetical protein HZT40_20640 [Candidatus Thiothrix singaporensis]|uniref:Uncharacterized protein n=1 Tax=Candidatus Thiothrix singaporensis TaxID=2799669 RepID=A0A7L6AX81_9GAMM|nr:MAG: hypothetical protein HZT40_20640 [Candidatus Thiothrix singaporensis]
MLGKDRDELQQNYAELKRSSSDNVQKLTQLGAENMYLKDNFNKLVDDNNDLVDRLRAISSVVIAVGTEQPPVYSKYKPTALLDSSSVVS